MVSEKGRELRSKLGTGRGRCHEPRGASAGSIQIIKLTGRVELHEDLEMCAGIPADPP